MSEWKAKRFWKEATVEGTEDGYRVLLDGRGVATPSKAPLIVPTRAMADAIAAEWDAQEGEIKPLTMPVTRAANSAIEKVTPQHAGVADMLAEYGGTDLLCYRAEGEGELTQRQAQGWDPLLDWAHERYGARLILGAGIMPVAQNPDAVARLRRAAHDVPPFPMTALHDLVTLTGSLILGLAVSEGHISARKSWALSRIDEDWQIEQWGADEEAAEAASAKEAQLLDAEAFWALCFSE
jgi:chaperone required for assembly of F1-ATPase